MDHCDLSLYWRCKLGSDALNQITEYTITELLIYYMILDFTTIKVIIPPMISYFHATCLASYEVGMG